MAAFRAGAASHSRCIVEAVISSLLKANVSTIGCAVRSTGGASVTIG
ncbi:hypothetical protein [Magnetospirillum fulvum]|nr:hypothetical protein [Magnetospirillum fulvum]